MRKDVDNLDALRKGSSKIKAPTSHDVARVAGVSQSAVSRVFSGKGSVSEETRDKVLEAAEKLRYRPNAFARGLTKQQSGLIAIIFPDTLSPLYHDALLSLSKGLMASGYSTILMPHAHYDDESHSLAKIFHYRVEGVIVMSSTLHSQLVKECANLAIPLVQFGRVEGGINTNCVVSDNEGGGRLAAELLVSSGAQNIVYIAGDPDTSTNKDRERGFCQQVKKLTGRMPAVYQAAFSYAAGVEAARALLSGPVRPDALFCATDMIAIGVIDVARNEFGIAIPQELQIIGFDDVSQASWLNYQLTTIRQDIWRVAEESLKILLNKIKHPGSGHLHMVLPVELVVRGTVKNSLRQPA